VRSARLRLGGHVGGEIVSEIAVQGGVELLWRAVISMADSIDIA
jgi:hypothetical protein